MAGNLCVKLMIKSGGEKFDLRSHHGSHHTHDGSCDRSQRFHHARDELKYCKFQVSKLATPMISFKELSFGSTESIITLITPVMRTMMIVMPVNVLCVCFNSLSFFTEKAKERQGKWRKKKEREKK